MFKKLYQKITKDSLYASSLYLIASSVVLMGTGFVFWILVARLFSAEQIGLANTTFSLLTTISGLSMLGITSGLTRFLPTSEFPQQKINTSLTVASVLTIGLSVIALYFLPSFSPSLLYLRQSPWFVLSFVAFCLLLSVHSIFETILLVYRKAINIFYKNTLMGFVKLIVPISLISFGFYGIVMAIMIGLLFATLYSFIVLSAQSGLRLRPAFHGPSVKRMAWYSVGSYVGSLSANLHTYFLPLLITNVLSAKTTAYYTIGASIAGIIFIIPQVVSQSLLVEGSHDEKNMFVYAKKALGMIMAFLIPAILGIILFGGYILQIFGKEYSDVGLEFLRIYALSGLFVGLNYVLGTLLYIQKRIRMVIVLSATSSLLLLVLSFSFRDMGLVGIGYATLLAQVGLSLLYGIVIGYRKQVKQMTKPVTRTNQKTRKK